MEAISLIIGPEGVDPGGVFPLLGIIIKRLINSGGIHRSPRKFRRIPYVFRRGRLG